MKFVKIVGPSDKLDTVADKIVSSGCFQCENVQNVGLGLKKTMSIKVDNSFSSKLKKVEGMAEGLGHKLVRDETVGILSPYSEDYFVQVSEDYDKLAAIDSQIADIEAKKRDNIRLSEQLLPILNVNIELQQLFNLEYIKFRFGRMPRAMYDRLSALEGDERIIFTRTAIEGNYIWGFYFSSEKYIDYVDSVMAALRFEHIFISEKLVGKPKEMADIIKKEAEESQKQTDELKTKKETLSDSIKAELNDLYSKLYIREIYNEVKKNCGYFAHNTFCAAGWIPASELEAFESELKTVDGLTYTVEEPSNARVKAPTIIRNFALFKPFEQFVRMYGLPAYDEIDPTPIVAVTYTLLFGMMFGDFGQGLVIALIGLFLAYGKKIQFGKILVICGISSAAFGILYDSCFGYEGLFSRLFSGGGEVSWGFSPGKDVMTTLYLAALCGIVLIDAVMITNIFNGIRQKDFEKIIFGYNGLAGLVLYDSLIFGLASSMFINTNVFTTPYVIGCIVVPILMIFFRHMLAKLVTGQKDWFPHNFLEYVLENFFELFEVFLSFATNTISFFRVGAFALNHAGMMLVVFLLAGTTTEAAFGSGNLVVVIFGNLFVMGLEGLLVGIQVLRLEFYELFSRFYSGDGTEFVPNGILKTK